MAEKPKSTSSLAQKELDSAEKQFEKFDQDLKEMTLDRMNNSPVQEYENKISQQDIERSGDVYLKPKRRISSKEKFNENYRKEYEYAKEYVQCIPKNIEIIGETITLWTKPFAGMPAEEWDLPTDKPVWVPRYVAEQLINCRYHRFIMKDTINSGDGMGKYYGSMAVDTVVQRLDALPVIRRKSIFMGANNF